MDGSIPSPMNNTFPHPIVGIKVLPVLRLDIVSIQIVIAQLRQLS